MNCMNLKFNFGKIALCCCVFAISSTLSVNGQTTKKKPGSILKGKVIETGKKKPLEFATVSVYKLTDSTLVKGTITNKRGEFEIDKLNENDYFLKVEYLGYKDFNGKKFVLKANERKVLSTPIPLSIDAKSISEVQVDGYRDFERVELDRTVYNVSNSPVSDGTLTDVLSTLPRLDVNADGEIQFRGSSDVKVLIDGKISGMLGLTPGEVLRNMPATDVDRIEIITSPSAKFEASGSSGIVNIIMKKERAKGFNANTVATIGTKDKHSGSFSFNQRSGKINLNGSYNYKNDWNGRDVFTNRTTHPLNLNSLQDADVEFGNRSHIGKLGLDFLIDDKNTISVSVTRKNVKQNWNGDYVYENRDLLSSANPATSERSSAVDIDLQSWVYNAAYIRKFNRKGQEFSIDVAYTDNSAENKGTYNELSTSSLFNKDFYKSDRKEAVVQADYIHPLGKSGKIETGYLFRSNEIDYKNVLPTEGAFNYKEQVQGLYFQYTGKSGKLAYSLGMRTEYSDIETSLDRNKDYFDFFPSMSLGYQIGKNKQLSLSYSKAIYRPNSRMVNPFQTLSDPNNQKRGNEGLDAYYTHKPELTFVYKRPKITYTTNLYYYYYDNFTSQFRTVDNSNGQATVSYINLDNKHYAGIDFNTKFNIIKWWSISTAMSGVYEKYSPMKEIDLKSNEEYLFHAKLTSTMRIPKFLTFQATCKYQENRALTQGDMEDFWNLDLIFAKRFWKRRAVLSFRVYDVFDSKKFKVNTSADNFMQRVKYDYESRIATLTFRYSFGKKYSVLKSKERKRTDTHVESDI